MQEVKERLLIQGVDMKAITEDGYKEFLSEISQFTPDEIFWLAENLSSKLKEIDTLTVSRLRPMVDAPRDGTDVQLANKSGRFIYGCNYGLGNSKWVIPGIGSYDDNDFLGWLPMPIYKPEKE